MKNLDNIILNLKNDTNNNNYIVYRKKIINKKIIYIIYNETQVSSDKVSDFIMRSLNNIDLKYKRISNINRIIKNDLADFKVKEVRKYTELIYYINSGFTIILVDNEYPLAFETKKDLARGISTPNTENSLRGPMDSFNENIETNIGLIIRRIKNNNLWIKEYKIGKYSETKVALLYINTIAKDNLVNSIENKLKDIDIDGLTNSGYIKNLIEKENKSVFPTVQSTERPDIVCDALLSGKIVITVDTTPFVLIIPSLFNDFFINADDKYNKSINVSFTRVVRYIAFFIALLAPALYIALTTYNQEMIPTLLIINFAAQRNQIPFPAFFEALIMIVAFEILRESDLRIPSFTSSALSIVGALILGEAAVNAGLVSPIMIIVISITSISALAFTEPELINGIRWYRFLFMLSAAFMGILGVAIMLTYFFIKLSSLKSFGKPYLMPFVPTYFEGLKNSIIKFPEKKLKKRTKYLSNNEIKMGEIE